MQSLRVHTGSTPHPAPLMCRSIMMAAGIRRQRLSARDWGIKALLDEFSAACAQVRTQLQRTGGDLLRSLFFCGASMHCWTSSRQGVPRCASSWCQNEHRAVYICLGSHPLPPDPFISHWTHPCCRSSSSRRSAHEKRSSFKTSASTDHLGSEHGLSAYRAPPLLSSSGEVLSC